MKKNIKVNNNGLAAINTAPIWILLLIALWLCEDFFGLFHQSPTIRFPIYSLLFVICYKKTTAFSKPLLLLFISMWLSIFSCKIYHNQSFIQSFSGYATFGAIAIYFVLLKIHFPIYKLEKIIFGMFLVFCGCYLYQMAVFPKPVFIGADNPYSEQLDMILRRIRMPGMSLVGLGLFYSLNKALLGKVQYFAFVILAVVMLLLFGFRTLIAIAAIFSFVMVVKINGFSWKLLIGLALVLGIIYGISLTSFGQETFEGMMERQEDDQNFGNKDYIRYTTLFYYTQSHFKDAIEFFLGSGIANRQNNPAYGQYYMRLESYGIHYYDWGILGMSWMMGMLSLIAMIWYPIKAFLAKLPKEKVFLSVWFGYLLSCGFTSAEFVRQGCFLVQGMVLYEIYVITLQNEQNNNSQQRRLTSTSRKRWSR